MQAATGEISQSSPIAGSIGGRSGLNGEGAVSCKPPFAVPPDHRIRLGPCRRQGQGRRSCRSHSTNQATIIINLAQLNTNLNSARRSRKMAALAPGWPFNGPMTVLSPSAPLPLKIEIGKEQGSNIDSIVHHPGSPTHTVWRVSRHPATKSGGGGVSGRFRGLGQLPGDPNDDLPEPSGNPI